MNKVLFIQPLQIVGKRKTFPLFSEIRSLSAKRLRDLASQLFGRSVINLFKLVRVS
ncbi:hypothetical protein IOC57_11015 [Bacillus sp. SD075]|uniref:hypothetical protein n=1 Tax=Bacillus sp. SD075 TaxID=2781732 RepID=UPI001A96002F|nr:hypothetical protein [Bacillus sp. SD075]MBO0998272.1 hypothetical protein [Bacillus sp. SD075]